MQLQVESYACRVKALAIVWLVYAGLSLLLGIAALAFANAMLSGNFGSWAHGPWAHGPWMHGGPLPPFWLGPAVMHFAWVYLLVRAGLELVAGWGLLERAPWGRVVAIVAAILNLLKFPLGTALGIWTLVVLLGYRNATLYEQLQ
jgi:hypothetical protein